MVIQIWIYLSTNAFDGVRGGTHDGFIAVFSKTLDVLHYGSYLGSNNADLLGVTSIRL